MFQLTVTTLYNRYGNSLHFEREFTIRVHKVPFRFFDKLKNEIQNSVLRFCFYFNKEDEIQITELD